MTELSPLERMLASIVEDKDQIPAFYEALLDAMLYVPMPGETPVGADAARKGAKLDLMVVQADSGRLFMPAFDRPDRALAYVTDDIGKTYAEVPARALIATLRPNIAIVLNPGGSHVKVFDPDELRYLRDEIRRIERGRCRPEEPVQKLVFRAVLDLPDDLAAALTQACAATPAVHAVYMLEIPDPEYEYGKKYLVLLDVDDGASDRSFEAAGEAVGAVLADHFAAGTFLELANLEEEEAWAEAVSQKNVPPVYSRAAAGG